jgi:hypothetical protein
MNVAEFIEYLKTQDQEAVVQVVVAENYGPVHDEVFDPKEHVELQNWIGNRYVKPTDPWYNKKIITFGKRDG